MSLESAADLIRSWNREICDPWIGLREKRFIDSLKGQNEIFHRLVALHQVSSSSNFHPSSPLFDFPSIHPRGCISAYVDAVNNARVNGKSSVNVLSVETIPGNVPAGGIVWIAKDGIDSTRYTIRFNSSLSLFLSLSWWRALRDDLLAVTLCICIYIYMYSKFHRLPRAWLETFGDRAPLKRNSIFELAWIGEGITSAARETRLKEEEEGNSRWRGIERRKGYFFLLNFTKGAPMTLTIAIPVCVSCEMGNERQTSTMSFHYFSSFSLLSNFITRFSYRREMHPEFRSSRFIFSQRIERIVLYIPPKEKILQERSRYPAFANTIDSGGGRWRGWCGCTSFQRCLFNNEADMNFEWSHYRIVWHPATVKNS